MSGLATTEADLDSIDETGPADAVTGTRRAAALTALRDR